MTQIMRTFSTSLVCLLVLMIALAQGREHSHKCIHDQLKTDYEYLDDPQDQDHNGRLLQSYSNIRIYFDTTNIDNLNAVLVSYIKNYLLPPAKNYFETTLKTVPYSGKLKFPGFSSVCGSNVPVSSFLQNTGVDADLVIVVTAFEDTSSNYIAYASSCLLSGTTSRPLLGNLNYNLAYIKATTNDADIEGDVIVTLHELTHALGFSSGLYSKFINPSTNAKLASPTTTKTVGSSTYTILTLSALTAKVRTYFNCPSAVGAYIEDDGGSASAGSHWERRIFYNEYMTASAIQDTRISEFTLALLEGTGWYQVDYTMADPMTYGKNEGCTFLDMGSCASGSTPNYKEFCTASVGCSWTARGFATCSRWDPFADNCPTFQIYSNKDCEDGSYQSTTTLPTKEYYGFGSKCFEGTLKPSPSYMTSTWGYCFKPTCVQNGASWIVQVAVGTTIVSCTAKQQVSVSGFGGYLQCPDPTDFCTRVEAEGYCRRGCMGKGTCVSKTCQCVDSWSGFDCSRSIYANSSITIDQCSACMSDPWRTTCSGANCICNPSNTTCSCQLGLMSTADCCKAGKTTGDACSESSSNIMIIAIAASAGGVALIAVIVIFIKRKAILRKMRGKSSGPRQQPRQQYEVKSPNTASYSGSRWEPSPNEIQSSSRMQGRMYAPRMNDTNQRMYYDSPVPQRSYYGNRI